MRAWVSHAKGSPEARDLVSRINWESVYREWAKWREGHTIPGLSYVPLRDDHHGYVRIRPGRFQMGLNDADSPSRQELAFVHELVHLGAYPYPTGSKVMEDAVHSLALGATFVVFPSVLKGETVLNDQDPGDNQYMETPEVFLTDVEQRALASVFPQLGLVAKGSRTPRRGGTLPTGDGKVVPNAGKDMSGLGRILSKYRGWAAPYVARAFAADSFIFPVRGVLRAAPLHDIGGWKARDIETFWDQLISALDASGPTKTDKEYVKATAVALANTSAALTATASIGLVCTLSDGADVQTSEPCEIESFYPAGQTQLDYLLNVEMYKGVAQFIILHPSNNRGDGNPSADTDLASRILADTVRVGLKWTVESLNLRDLE